MKTHQRAANKYQCVSLSKSVIIGKKSLEEEL